MHQHPRPPPVTASPANSEQTNPSRTNNPRDRDLQYQRALSPRTHGSGSSEDFASSRQDQPADNPAAQISRLNQVIQNFHTKAALIILHSRVNLAPAYSRGTENIRSNKWFNIELDETEDYRDDIRRWKTCNVTDDRPPPLVIEIFLQVAALGQNQSLVILDAKGKRWDVLNELASSENVSSGKKRAASEPEVILERWTIQLGDATGSLPADMAVVLPLVYKKSIVLFRSLFTYCNFLPAHKLSKARARTRSHSGLKLGYRIVDGTHLAALSRPDNLTVPLGDGADQVASDYSFGVTDSPAGPFSVSVTYRNNCEFRIDDSESLLSSHLLGSDADMFPQTESPDEHPREANSQEFGSLPTDHRRNLIKRPDLGQAYGSLSTFHQVGAAPGTSPISALRNAHELGSDSPPAPEPARLLLAQTSSQSYRSTPRVTSTTGVGRRSSLSFQPFKAPVLSASPLSSSPLATSPRTSSTRVPILSSLAEERGIVPPSAFPKRKSVSLASDHAISPSASSSPKPAPMARYSSSFSQRRARMSTGGTTLKTDDEHSSGKASAASSNPPGSGLITEAATGGASSGSMQEDDENISDFLKMLDLQKNLLTPADAAAKEASTRRTAAALTRFHRMKDSNTALSDSLSSSLMLHRSSSSSSRQLSSLPQMVAATSVSTSSSPGKPISPHTPHTPFAPSRLSAAYSHDDADPPHITIAAEPVSPSDGATSDSTAQAQSTVNVPAAINIPNSPRPFTPGYQRSSSAQRRPLADDEGIFELDGMRSASMGAQDTRPSRLASNRTQEPEGGPLIAAAVTHVQADVEEGPEISPRQSSLSHAAFAPSLRTAADDPASGSASGQSSRVIGYRSSRTARGGAVGRGTTPPQASTSSFGGGTGGSVERDRDSGGSGSGSWGGRGVGGSRRRGSRPENKLDDDEDFPFAMEKSDLVGLGKGTVADDGLGGGPSRR